MLNATALLVCRKCGKNKDVSGFYVDRRYGRPRTICIECCIANKSPNSGKRTPKRRAEYARQRGDRDCAYVPQHERLNIAAAKRAARAEQRSKPKSQRAFKPWVGSKEWLRTASAEKIEEYRTKCKAKWRARYESNPLAERMRARQYKHANPEAVARHGSTRQSRVAIQSDGSLTADIVRQLFDAACSCPYCLCELDDADKSLDHIEPVSRGGVHGVSNVVICCLGCNLKKQAKPIDVWLAEIGRDYIGTFGSLAGDQSIRALRAAMIR
jgi:hypothetical protein